MLNNLFSFGFPVIRQNAALPLFFLLFTPALLLHAAPAHGEPPSAVRVGIILPLTGAHAQTAVAMKNAAQLAQEDLGTDSGTLQLLFEDDELSGAKAISAFNKLAARDKISAVVTFGGQSVAALAPVAGQTAIPLIALTADSNLVRGHPFVFQHWLSSEEQAQAVFHALAQTPVQKVALVSTTHNAALDILNKFEAQARASGLQVVYRNDFAPGQVDFRGEIAKLRTTKPDAVLCVLVLPHMSLFAKQLRQSGVASALYCSANAETAAEVQAAGSAMEGVVYAGPALDPGFVARFEAKFGAYPEFAAPHVYDAVMLFGTAIINGARSGGEINDYLHKQPVFTGAMGKYSLAEGFRFAVSAATKTIRNGKFVPWQPRSQASGRDGRRGAQAASSP